MNALRIICYFPFLKKLLSKTFRADTPQLERTLFGLRFSNPVGLGAGFDKNARYLNELEALGFGFVEIGTVTPLPQQGNDKPRLFRLPEDKALINRMGFNNEGVKLVARRLKAWKEKQSGQAPGANPKLPLIVGGNIGKNKITANEDAWKDYATCFTELFDCVDYFVVNVSSPNTPGLRELQEKDSLKKILSHLQTLNLQQSSPKPLLLKIAPDLSFSQLDDVIDLAIEIKLDGLVAANTTIARDGLKTAEAKLKTIGNGGLSGKPLQARANQVLEYIQSRSKGTIPVIGSGGIFSGPDAKQRLASGASLLQVWTGFIYEGPGITKKINTHIQDARYHS